MNSENAGLLHSWDVTPSEAVKIQEEIRHRVVLSDRIGTVRFVGGADVGYEDKNRITRAAVAVLRFPELELDSWSIVRQATTFPYIPGLLSFREAPALMAALGKLKRRPDLLFCDGQGIAHPRRMGIASHIGILAGLPTIGVGKTRLVGTHQPVPEKKGSRANLVDRSELVGSVLRTRTGVKPLYISPGHNICLKTAVEYVLACTTRYRLPETTRWAHRLASEKAKS